MALPFYNWSLTAASNATADSTVNWSEGQSPSSVNDSARAMMASTAAFRDDISGTITTGGTSTAYTVTSNQVFDTLAHMDGAMIAFTPHVDNGDTVTLNVDGLGAKPLRFAPSVELPSNSLLLGTPYVATYYNTAGEWILQGAAFSNPYGIPLAGGLDYWATTAPSSAFVFPYGQAISRTTYATLFAKIGTTFGSGDGSSTFNLPDKRGYVSAALDNMGGTSAGRLTPPLNGGVSNSLVLGSSGGNQGNTLALANLPNTTLAVSASGTASVVSTVNDVVRAPSGLVTKSQGTGPSFVALPVNTGTVQVIASTGTASVTGSTSSLNGGVTQTAHNNVQPTIMCNYILRVLSVMLALGVSIEPLARWIA